MISKLPSLNRFFVQDNHLSGNLDKVFNGSYQRYLNNVQLSNNQFTGELPEQLFLSSSLVSVSAVSNCFHGSIPDSICLNTKLQTLALDGLVCASSCRKKILPGLSSSYISDRKIIGGIPYCLWLMTNLQVLHISGNSLTGTLPTSKIILSSALVDLSLSYNLLSGSIPNFIQEHNWNNLDLSHNRLSGTLSSSFNSTSNSSSLSLDNNRMSGYIPNNIHDMVNINILEGSFYDCKLDRSDLPSNDNYKDTYDCGSNLVDVLCYVWLGLMMLELIILFAIWYYKDGIAELSILTSNIKQWLNIAMTLNTKDEIVNYKLQSMIHLQRFIAIHEIIGRCSLYCTLFIIIILLPIYAVLSIYYRTHTRDYIWSVALIYLTGKVAFGISFSALMIHIFTQILCYLWTAKKKSFYSLFHYVTDEIIRQDNYSRESKSNRLKVWWIYTTYTAINLIIVGGVNVLYVLAVFYGSSSVIIIVSQILISMFKLIWNNTISPKMVRWIVNYLSIRTIDEQSTLFFLQFIVSIFNNIIIPCFLIMIISPNCLYNAFREESNVTSMFYFTDCQIVNSDGICIDHITYQSSTSYSPPYSYSYQCSSAFIEYYAPVFVFVCILSTFIIPVLQILWIRWKLPNILQFGNLFHPVNDTKISVHDGTKISVLINIDEVYRVLVLKLTFIGLIMTFGTIFPPLAGAFFFAIMYQSYYHQIILGRFLTHVSTFKVYSQLDKLEDDLKVQPLLSTLQKCGWVLLYVACSFYTLFLFDILGDSMGYDGSYWVLIVVPCIPLFIHTCTIYYFSYIYKNRNNGTTNNQSNDAIQLSPSLRFVSNPITIEMDNDRDGSNIDNDRDGSIIDINAQDRHGDSIIIC